MDIAAKNNSGSTILKGKVVRQTGFVQPEQVPSIDLANATTSSTATVLGIVVSSIANGSVGQVRISGSYTPIDTSGFVLNSYVYLSDTPGEISMTPGTVESIIGTAKTVSTSGCGLIAHTS